VAASTVNVTPVTNGHDINEPLIVINAVENSVVADPYSPEITAAL